MATVLAAAIYSRGGFSLCLAGSTGRVMVPGGSTFHLEPGTIGCWYSVDKNVDVDLHREDEDGAVEGKGLYN